MQRLTHIDILSRKGDAMKPFNVMFEEQHSQEIIYNGKLIKRYLAFDGCAYIRFTIENIEQNSNYTQAIVLSFENDFRGRIVINGEEFKLPKSKFPQIHFWADMIPQRIVVETEIAQGSVWLCGGADPLGTKQLCSTLTYGSALYLESIRANQYVVHCNDFENDDDFDDLVFNMQIECIPKD